MNIRSDQKNRIKTILESIVYNSSNLPVFIGVKTQNDQWPYAFITSGGLTPNKDGGTLRDRGTYERVREYQVTLLFMLDDSSPSLNQVEIQIDQLEQLVINKLGEEATRNDGQSWFDLYVTSVSEPINGQELQIIGNTLAKIFTIVAETQEEYS